MSQDKKPREFWLDIATPYGDPCDFIQEGKPHEHPEATNIHVREVMPEQAESPSIGFDEDGIEERNKQAISQYPDATPEQNNNGVMKSARAIVKVERAAFKKGWHAAKSFHLLALTAETYTRKGIKPLENHETIPDQVQSLNERIRELEAYIEKHLSGECEKEIAELKAQLHHRHIIGKVYEVTAENITKLAGELDETKAELAELKSKLNST